jgi:hypothetical protein
MRKFIIAAVAVAAALALPGAADASSGWRLCHRGNTPVNTILTGNYGSIDVWAPKGQNCRWSIRAERWLRVDRGGATSGWRTVRSENNDVGDGDYWIEIVLRKGHRRIKIIQYIGDGWG